MSKVNPKIDLVFKKLFGSEENKDILLSLINAVLPENQQIVEVKIKNPYNVSDYIEGKLTVLDIKAEDEQGNLYDIEMQIKGTTFYGKRTLYYWAKIFGSQLDYLKSEEKEKKKRKTYSELNKCIVISLMDFEFFDDDKYHRCFMLKDRETDEIHPDLDYLDLYFIELEKFENKYKTLKTTLDRWVKFLNNADLYSKDTLPQELAEVESIKKASERLDVMYLNEKEREYYDAQQKRYLDETARIQEAVEQAELNSKIEIARKMVLAGSENNFIAQMTDLTGEQIEQLRNEKQ
ncbi:MAG: Rpn family recombination-promoting nuclease/putative transposase [Microscillaceae bacterium]|nr:Rpn family recombination-promoting nuclease/putative transposase [Microscillaceae bacterium]